METLGGRKGTGMGCEGESYDVGHEVIGVVHTLERAKGESREVLFDPKSGILFLSTPRPDMGSFH
jgi:hypothetical protein